MGLLEIEGCQRRNLLSPSFRAELLLSCIAVLNSASKACTWRELHLLYRPIVLSFSPDLKYRAINEAFQENAYCYLCIMRTHAPCFCMLLLSGTRTRRRTHSGPHGPHAGPGVLVLRSSGTLVLEEITHHAFADPLHAQMPKHK